MSTYNYLNRDEFEKYNNFASNSLRSSGAQTIQAKKGTKTISKSKHNMKVKKLKDKGKRLLVILMILLGLVVGVNKTMDHISRHRDYKQNVEFCSTYFPEFCAKADVKFAIDEDKNIVLLEDDNEKIEKLYSVMEEEINLKKSHDFVLLMKKVCGEEGFDKSSQVIGYDDSKDFLVNNYFSGPLSSNGETLLAKYPDEKKFENNREESLNKTLKDFKTKKLNEIQEYKVSKEQEKGMSK